MKLATWNINSLNVRLQHVLDWLAKHSPDVVCLQETKLEDARFPADSLRESGYHAIYTGQRSYNGVAILSRAAPSEVTRGIDGYEDVQQRVIAGCFGDVRVVCVYVPNGEVLGSSKFEYKMSWIAALRGWLEQEVDRYPHLVVAGDYNIAPEERDVHDPAAWAEKIHFTAPEREALQSLFDIGLADAFRLFDQPERSYTWWDYRMMAFRRKMGLRIDHILLSPGLSKRCTSCLIDVEPRRLERPSDHAPVVAELTLP